MAHLYTMHVFSPNAGNLITMVTFGEGIQTFYRAF